MIEVTCGRVDVDVVHRYLSDESYWAKGITRERVARSIEHSIPFSAFEDGVQVGLGLLDALLDRLLDRAQVHRGVNQCDVREGLREVAQHALAHRVVFLRQQVDVVAQREQALEERA